MKYLFSLFLLFIGFSVTAQNIEVKGRIVEGASNRPVSIAFLFVNNTSYGAETDEQGNFSLELPIDLSGELIISHINCASKSIDFVSPYEIPDTISLDLEPYELDEVLVTENKGKNRKKWLKKFERSFLGEDDKNKIEIINPNDILFSERNDTLKAFAKQPIMINNHRLGYKVRFFLDQFIQLNDQVAYSGKAFFEEMKGVSKKVRASREEEYLQSTRYFLRKLIEDSTPDDFFDCYEAMFLESGDYMITDSYNVKDYVFQLYNTGYYALSIPNSLYVNGFGDLKSRKYNRIRKNLGKYSSFIIPQSGVIIFNEDGVILNFKEVEEIGYWATKRVGALLPFNFIPGKEDHLPLRSIDWVSLGFITNTIYADDSISSRLRKDGMLVDPVDLFLHADRSIYLPGETIWFSIYGKRNKGRISGNYGVAVELRNHANDPEVLKIIPCNDGIGNGFLTLPDSVRAGDYLLRYYLANNEIESVYNEIPISIVKNDESKSNSSSRALDLSDSIYIRFYPEGGVLVDGIQSKVAFEVTDQRGNYVDFNGELVIGASGNLIPIKTLYKGMGYIQLNPSISENYHILRNEDYPPIKYVFPEVSEKGGILSASTKLDNVIKIDARSNTESSFYRLIGHANGVVYSDHIFYNDQEVFLFNKEFIPTGILHFTLFDEKNRPLAERLVFNDFGYHTDLLNVNPSTSFFRKKSQVNMDVSLDQYATDDTLAYLSIAVTDDNLYDPSKSTATIASEWYVNVRLDHIIPDLSNLLESIGQKERFVMDLYLMVRGWRRFNWEKLNFIENQVNQGINIQGEVNSEESALKVVLTNFSNSFYYDEQEIINGPQFSFTSVPVSVGGNYILQLKDKENDELIKAQKGRLLIDTITPSTHDSRYIHQLKSLPNGNYQPLIENGIKKLQQDSMVDFSFNVDLDEVLIKEKRERDVRIYGLNDISKLDWIDPSRTPVSLISSMRPGARFLRSTNGTLQFEIMGDRGAMLRINAKIFIDGQIQYDGKKYFNLAKFNSLTADRILYYGVNPPVISIYTDPNGPRSLQNQQYNIYNYLLPGIEDYKEFYRPVYELGDSSPDYRTTIHWQSGIVLKRKEKVNINFYSGDEDAVYTYVIQGMTTGGKPIYKKGKIEIKE